ncbi:MULTISPECIES: gliding motility-associated C-terminal domain-containing protein [unclassified Saccharicrinis]|uniref:gliding motility-associated C-terminal domain-containing protein n=1 Tax=unclassified Saccharicrinis TaxID=2646859 RepID=UPI003D34BB25
MNKFYKYAILLLFATTTHISAQIISTGHSSSLEAEYSVSDSLFFYTDISSAALSATPPVGGTNITYTWEKYENGSWNSAVTGNDPTFIDIADGGAYRVTVNDNGTPVGQYVCWTFQPEIMEITVDTIYSNCNNIQLNAETATKTLNYMNPSTGDAYSVNYQLDYTWTSDPASDPQETSGAQPVLDAPAELITYTVSASAFNGAHTLEAAYDFTDPIAVVADFSYNVLDRENENELPGDNEFTNLTDDFTGSAEIIVLINDSSKGFNKSYSVDFELQTSEGEEKPSEDGLIEIVFDKLGEYSMIVTVKNDISGCTDFTTLGNIKIEEIELQAPNVFTPDGDGINDEFRVVYRSVKQFKMVIFNRWGRKVFHTTNPGKGWDGKIAGKDAAEGVYFYVITATGYNEGESRKLEDALHLFRGN